MDAKELYEISVQPGLNGKLSIVVDGVRSETDVFEFAAPLGTGLAVEKVTRVELVSDNIRRRSGVDY